jgi:hypothetical protein
MSRRTFLKGAAVTAVAATATGAGAAVLSQRDGNEVAQSVSGSFGNLATAPVVEAPSLPTSATVSDAQVGAVPTATAVMPAASIQPVQDEQLLANLAHSQAENLRLQAELDAVRRDLESATAFGQEQQVVREALRQELDQANGRIGILGGLVALYEQLDGIDMGELLNQGIDSLSTSFNELLGEASLLSAGVESGELALAEVEGHLPLLENGRQWLEAQANKVEGFYGEVETVLRNAVERIGTFLEMLGDWFEGLQRWLPFGIGQKAIGVMSALTTLIAETPNTLSGLHTNIAQPLDVWLARETEGPALQRTLIKPLREQLLTRAAGTIAKTENTRTTYERDVAEPVRTALGTRQVLREQILAYRQQHQV